MSVAVILFDRNRRKYGYRVAGMIAHYLCLSKFRRYIKASSAEGGYQGWSFSKNVNAIIVDVEARMLSKKSEILQAIKDGAPAESDTVNVRSGYFSELGEPERAKPASGKTAGKKSKPRLKMGKADKDTGQISLL